MRLLSFSFFVLSTVTLALTLLVLSVVPFPERRRRVAARAAQIWSRAILAAFRIRVDPDFAADSTRPRVIVANHVSYLDIPVLLSLSPKVFIAKQEVAEWPLVGTIAKLLGTVFVDRASLFSRARSVLDLQQRLQDGVSVVVFPEGSTSLDGPVPGSTNFFAGAFRIARMEDASVEVLHIEYEDPDRCAWLGDAAFVPHVWNLYRPEVTSVRVFHGLATKIHSRRDQRAARTMFRSWLVARGLGRA